MAQKAGKSNKPAIIAIYLPLFFTQLQQPLSGK
jgi:hypothetical protein